jgi:hypothetical protein
MLFLAPILVSPFVYRMVQKIRKATGPLSPSISTIRFEAAQIHLLMGVAWFVVFLMKIAL